MAQLRRLTESYVADIRRSLNATSKNSPVRAYAGEQDGMPIYENTGETRPNPNYERLQKKLGAAEIHLQTWNRIKDKAKTAGYKQNQYAGTCRKTGDAVKPYHGFIRKEGARWATYSAEAVIDALGVELVNLPELDD